jgi:hypothetical protein
MREAAHQRPPCPADPRARPSADRDRAAKDAAENLRPQLDAELVRHLLRRQVLALVRVCSHAYRILHHSDRQVGNSGRMKLPIDEARLLPRFRDRVQLGRQQGDVLRGEFRWGGKAGIDAIAPRARRNDGVMVDALELRGLPVVGRGVGGLAS